MHAPRLKHASNREGFTLLELLLVLLILSAVAFTMMSQVADDASQVRYDDTRNRLDAIRTAIVGATSPIGWDRGIQMGYVVDNGVLPTNMNALVEVPTGYAEFGAVAPILDPSLIPGDEISLDEPKQQLMKGHRGSYVSASSESTYRDGWGNIDADATVDAENHGWHVIHSSTNLSIASYGMDGAAGMLTDDAYEADVAMTPIATDDWTIDLTGAEVTLKNLTGTNVSFSGKSYYIALLVFENDETGGEWTLYPTDEIIAESLGTTATNFQTTVTFPDTTDIPIGQHLLVLYYSYPYGGYELHGSSPDESVTARVKFFSRGGVPDMTLEIR